MPHTLRTTYYAYFVVTYPGFLQRVTRYFSTRDRAVQWCAQVGKPDARIELETNDTLPKDIH